MKLSIYSFLLLGSLFGSCVQAFSLIVTRQSITMTTSSGSARLWMSEPSDTSSDTFDEDGNLTDNDPEIVEIESESYNPTPAEAVVNSVMDLMPASSLNGVSEETRAAINEALVKLERLNPTTEPTISPLLNGVWELRYAGGYSLDGAVPSPTRQAALFAYSGGYSPGLFALTLAQKLPSALVECDDLEIAIARSQPRVEASIQVQLFGMAAQKIAVTARLETLSDVRLREVYEAATVLDQAVGLPAPLQYGRDLYVTYLDDDLLVVRDASGIPEVLVRKEKTFRTTPVQEP